MPAATAPHDVILVHSSVAGAGQWRAMVPEFDARFRLHTPDLIGYGAVPAWRGDAQTLGDQADHLASALPESGPLSVVGHSFGGSVAMELAARHPDRIARLVLIEPNPFALLAESGATSPRPRRCAIASRPTGPSAHGTQQPRSLPITGPGRAAGMPCPPPGRTSSPPRLRPISKNGMR
ncbi:alpha/beta fold hydrolase [Marinovum sp.]|uniref:alpha/beta fold hydrolase n=1 Tax=Marinovum sp. TaxID=2024839 RepID=UPI003A900D20